jgi:heme exporter protein D
MIAATVLTGWYVGYVIAAVIITIVVVLVSIILALARRIGVQADVITGALDQARINTLPLWEVVSKCSSLTSHRTTCSSGGSPSALVP